MELEERRAALDVRRLPGLTPYAEAWELQRELVRKRRSGEIPDTLLLLEHPPVYTVGRAARDASNLGAGEEYLRSLGAEVFWSDRGGDATFHGPGQLVGYPIIRLKVRDTHRYLRDLEEVVIRALAGYGLEGRRHPRYTGVWVNGSKICAIGVKFSSGWIASHGFALNVNTDLSWFDRITPCGIREYGVTSLERELGREIPLAGVEREIVSGFREVLGDPGS
ncbi:lipoate-protein ligase B [Rubrobacter xylanophilus DSM 9941]|uniref:Octanoyltransferase n=1 Tax=Rubrobacter xylanophilus (strain DSM 9941 / JCM 11954 / NBRC 16129 / PRD-1) TaxID=266117 RepID=LIPB_RUBXD|nr:lipoyl(octanoyl) transferase LipB [Rubrobacter xylanophilus]Q1AT14.1 RecName: Full=Octanoyltransferase; AltName: Full=Lipoate-protein ligase B; AltName: Full=Lipoyl/octanoyl transferase; AltName: Full=Octanoyl-[acyl-carrier-protein]-protein N-octanoyltransferase [Rubrobacter xylanophilus DSM 9941]ABG05464.1 lipoate-protein ligase B [Rubrobacter xylanophilus DSM 9941]